MRFSIKAIMIGINTLFSIWSIKLVSEASQQIYDKDSRDSYIRAKIKSRHVIPAYRSKQDFNVAAAQ